MFFQHSFTETSGKSSHNFQISAKDHLAQVPLWNVFLGKKWNVFNISADKELCTGLTLRSDF